jgi:hypothetical protein
MISQKVKIRWQSKKLQIQGAQILRNEAYLQYAAVTKDVAQHRSWTFYEAINIQASAAEKRCPSAGKRIKSSENINYWPAHCYPGGERSHRL